MYIVYDDEMGNFIIAALLTSYASTFDKSLIVWDGEMAVVVGFAGHRHRWNFCTETAQIAIVSFSEIFVHRSWNP